MICVLQIDRKRNKSHIQAEEEVLTEDLTAAVAETVLPICGLETDFIREPTDMFITATALPNTISVTGPIHVRPQKRGKSVRSFRTFS